MTRYYIEPREEIYQRIWTFVIRGKSVQQIRKKLLDTVPFTIFNQSVKSLSKYQETIIIQQEHY